MLQFNIVCYCSLSPAQTKESRVVKCETKVFKAMKALKMTYYFVLHVNFVHETFFKNIFKKMDFSLKQNISCEIKRVNIFLYDFTLKPK